MDLYNRKISFGGEIVPASIASAPQIVRGARKMSVTPIPGSNREVVEMEDAWESYDQPYTLFVGDGSEDSIQEVLNETARVLYKTGWQELRDEYEPDYFRLAYYQGPFNVENRYTRLGKFDVSFKCRAERFLLSGNFPVGVTTGGKLTNPTVYKAKPLIHITGSGNGTLTVGSTTVTIKNLVDYLNIDCETQNCYRLTSENKNNMMEGNFPVLESGENTISFTGGISTVTITPRYFVI